jgi:uncharacterized membrane protein
MMKRAILAAFCAAVMLAQTLQVHSADAPAQSPSAATNRINILFLTDDLHRGNWLGTAGADRMITPNIDRQNLVVQQKSQRFRANSPYIVLSRRHG